MAIFFQAAEVAGRGCFITKCAMPNINAEASINRGVDNTNGCTECKPILVADEAEAHSTTKVIPDNKLSSGLLELLMCENIALW